MVHSEAASEDAIKCVSLPLAAAAVITKANLFKLFKCLCPPPPGSGNKTLYSVFNFISPRHYFLIFRQQKGK